MGEGTCPLCKKRRRRIESELDMARSRQIEKAEREARGFIRYHSIQFVLFLPLFVAILVWGVIGGWLGFFLALPFFILFIYLVGKREDNKMKIVRKMNKRRN